MHVFVGREAKRTWNLGACSPSGKKKCQGYHLPWCIWDLFSLCLMVKRRSSNVGSTHFSKILLSAPSVEGTPCTVCALVNTGPVLSWEGSWTRWPLKPILAPSSAFKTTRHWRAKTILCAAWITYNPKVQLSLSSLPPLPPSLYVSLLLSPTPLLSSHPFAPSLLLSSTPLFFLSLTCAQVHTHTHTHALLFWQSIMFDIPFSSCSIHSLLLILLQLVHHYPSSTFKYHSFPCVRTPLSTYSILTFWILGDLHILFPIPYLEGDSLSYKTKNLQS